jgi:hypothetical protein
VKILIKAVAVAEQVAQEEVLRTADKPIVVVLEMIQLQAALGEPAILPVAFTTLVAVVAVVDIWVGGSATAV